MTGLQPFDPLAVALVALLNPVVVVVAVLMGRVADQPQKLLVAGFAAALAGAAAVWIVTWLRLLPARGVGGESGIFMLQLVLGTGWAALGYYLAKRRAG